MFWYLTKEEQDLAVAAREYARAKLIELDRTCDHKGGSICEALPDLANMGFMSMRLPESFNGLNLSRTCYAAILHEISYASPSAAVTLSVHNMVGEMLLRFGSTRVKSELLPCWGQAQHHGAFAITEADAGSDPAACSTRGAQRDGTWVINGAKMWITSGAQCRWFVVLVQTANVKDYKGLCMVLVDGTQDGFERLPITGKMGIRASETFSLHLTDVSAPQDHLLGDLGSGLTIALSALDGGRIGIAAQSSGITEACLDEMVAYAKQRVQFGRPIADFQAIQKMIADSKVELEASESLIAQACCLEDHGDRFTAAAAKAKLFASETASRVADRAVQVLGGSGYVNDYRVEQLYRDARVTRLYEGTSEIQRLVIGRQLLKNARLDFD